MAAKKVEYQVKDGLARIIFVNEAGGNALDLQACNEFAEAAAQTRKDSSIKAVLLEARGKSFSVGGDIRGFVANKDNIHQHVIDMTKGFHGGISDLRNGTAPLIIAVNGVAAGGGFSLVCSADMAIAKRSAKFVAAYSRSGLSPDGGGTWFLPRIVGIQKAFDIFATNPTLSAEQARDLGIISRVVEDDDFEAEVDKLARMIVESPPGALAALKKLLNASTSATLQEQFDAEANSIASLAASPSTMERLMALLGKSEK